jgi:putative spermidine/putrescine transport system substrate-binding protein
MRRRELLAGAGATLAAAPFAGIAPAAAQAKPENIVVMTWGGLFGDSVRQGVDQIFEKETGVKVVQDRGSSPVERVTKLKVGLADQQVDCVMLHDGLFPLARKQGVLEKLDRTSPRLSNLKDVYPQFVKDDWVACIFTAIGITYNKKLVKTPPTSFADLWRPEFKGRIVLPEISHSAGTYIIPVGALAQGKDPKDAATGFEMLKKMVDLKPIWQKDTDAIMTAFREEEAVIGLFYKSQTYTVQGWGAPVEWVFPKEGAIGISWGTGIARGTKRKEEAESWLNATLDPAGQAVFAKSFNYPGSNRKTIETLPPELQERTRVSDDELKRLVELDHEFMANERGAWTERWNRVVAGG